MKKIILLVAFVFIVGCEGSRDEIRPENVSEQYGMTCVKVFDKMVPAYIYRCENDEVICYLKSEYRSSPFCFKK